MGRKATNPEKIFIRLDKKVWEDTLNSIMNREEYLKNYTQVIEYILQKYKKKEN